MAGRSTNSGNEIGNLIGSPSKAFLIIKREAKRTGSGEARGLSSMSRLLAGSNAQADPAAHEILRVQYNPSSLSIRANAGEVQIKSMQQTIDSSTVIQQVRPPSVVLSVTLIFDAVNLQDAFMSDKFRVSAADAVSSVKGGISAAREKNTVKTQINGLIGMILDHTSRQVTFLWRDMSFTGYVDEINSEYTMFNMAGNPIRGSVTMNIVQSLGDKGDLDAWDKAFDNNFKEESGGKNSMEKMGNLLNINL